MLRVSQACVCKNRCWEDLNLGLRFASPLVLAAGAGQGSGEIATEKIMG